MPEELGSLLTTALTITTLATLAGLGLLRGTVTNLREQLRDERDANSSHRQKRTDDEKEIAQLTADLGALQRIVTGEIHWVALGTQMTDQGEALKAHHDAAEQHWEADERLLREIRDQLRTQPRGRP